MTPLERQILQSLEASPLVTGGFAEVRTSREVFAYTGGTVGSWRLAETDAAVLAGHLAIFCRAAAMDAATKIPMKEMVPFPEICEYELRATHDFDSARIAEGRWAQFCVEPRIEGAAGLNPLYESAPMVIRLAGTRPMLRLTFAVQTVKGKGVHLLAQAERLNNEPIHYALERRVFLVNQ